LVRALAGVDFVHAAFGQVAAGEGGPFVVHLEEHGGDQPQERFVVGEDLDDVGPTLDLAVDPFQWVVEAAGTQFGDGQVEVAGLRGQRLAAVPVAVGGAGLGVLVPLGADPGRGLGLDQLLQDPLGHTPHEFESVRRT